MIHYREKNSNEWVWMRDVKNQYVFHKKYKEVTHQIEFEKLIYVNSWIRKRKIMRILNEGFVKIRYSVFSKDYLTALYTIEKSVDIKDVKILFGEKVYSKIMTIT